MATGVLTRTDQEIQKDVFSELKWDAQVQPNEIGVSVKDGVVTLTGWVDSYIKKWSAEEAAHRVSGVRAVANDIEVKLATERTDADIAKAAVHALEWDAVVPSDKIHVTVSKGWVTLKGEVEWQYQKEDAERVVRRLTGVRGVVNLITVTPWATPSELKRKIEDDLVRQSSLRALLIFYSERTDGGTSMMHCGKVGSHAVPEEIRDIRGTSIRGAEDSRLEKVADVIFDHDTMKIRYLGCRVR